MKLSDPKFLVGRGCFVLCNLDLNVKDIQDEVVVSLTYMTRTSNVMNGSSLA